MLHEEVVAGGVADDEDRKGGVRSRQLAEVVELESGTGKEKSGDKVGKEGSQEKSGEDPEEEWVAQKATRRPTEVHGACRSGE